MNPFFDKNREAKVLSFTIYYLSTLIQNNNISRNYSHLYTTDVSTARDSAKKTVFFRATSFELINRMRSPSYLSGWPMGGAQSRDSSTCQVPFASIFLSARQGVQAAWLVDFSWAKPREKGREMVSATILANPSPYLTVSRKMRGRKCGGLTFCDVTGTNVSACARSRPRVIPRVHINCGLISWKKLGGEYFTVFCRREW